MKFKFNTLSILDYAEYLVNFGLLYRNIRNKSILCNEDLEFVKKKQKKQPSSYQNYNNNVLQHLPIEEFLAS